MTWFVSRARYEEAIRERDSLREENKKLLDRLLMNSGLRPIYQPLPEEAKPAAEKKDNGEDIPLRSGRHTMSSVKSMAEHAARIGKMPDKVRPVTL